MNSVEIEQAVLSLLMWNPELMQKCQDISPQYFMEFEHSIIFDSIKTLHDKGSEIDYFIVSDSLANTDVQAEYLSKIYEDARPQASLFDSYLGLLKERHDTIRRTELLTDAANASSAEKAIELAQKAIDNGVVSERKTTFSLNELLKTGVDRIDERFHSEGEITGLATGFTTLDNATAGFQDGDYVVIGGRPAMGKTAILMNIVGHALMQDKHVVVFSLEMSADQLMDRLFSSVGGIDAGRIKTGNLKDDDFEKLASATNKLKDKNLFIDERGSISPQYIDTALRSREREHGKIDLVLVDYLQLLRIPSHKGGKVNEVSDISGALKSIAKKYSCPLITLSQLSRAVESRPNKRPLMSDLRESGAIEQDADVIAFLYRDEYYNPETEKKGVAELIVGKNRNGEVGTHYLNFQGRYTRFLNMIEID